MVDGVAMDGRWDAKTEVEHSWNASCSTEAPQQLLTNLASFTNFATNLPRYLMQVRQQRQRPSSRVVDGSQVLRVAG